MIPWLDSPVKFPATRNALTEPNGLLAAGGDLSLETMLNAYQQGIFPWYQEPDPILWWSPSPRFVIKPSEVYVSKSMAKLLRKNPWTLRANSAFTEVMRACAEPREYTNNTWINSELIEAYHRLHQHGYAHSVEVWDEGRLIGGLYGVALGKVFFGESMFSRQSNTSKYAFIHLCRVLGQAGFALIDCQVHSDHLQTLGAKEIDRGTFEHCLQQYHKEAPLFSPWDAINNEPRFTDS